MFQQIFILLFLIYLLQDVQNSLHFLYSLLFSGNGRVCNIHKYFPEAIAMLMLSLLLLLLSSLSLRKNRDLFP